MSNRGSPRCFVPGLTSGEVNANDAGKVEESSGGILTRSGKRLVKLPVKNEAGCGDGTVDAQEAADSGRSADDQKAVDSETVDAQDVNLLGATEELHPAVDITTVEKGKKEKETTNVEKKAEEAEKKEIEAKPAEEQHGRSSAPKRAAKEKAKRIQAAATLQKEKKEEKEKKKEAEMAAAEKHRRMAAKKLPKGSMQRYTDIIGSILPLMEKTAEERKAASKRTLGSTTGSSWPFQKNMKME
ncbi:hypothetical protein B9Z55_026685 [Caenorhabditis nigoni]|uniref:Uncharacterized protein n=1 Tax=Caenorhabditis nigoni TaxID=1611254 RepID=A0A2G5T488_9PELO|nr:hypothetical protein B9Z55_026685 [Caenorhabditis nigoni]